MSDSPKRVCPRASRLGLSLFGLFFTAALLMVAGCGGGGSDSPTGVPSTTVVVSPGTETVWIGETVSFTVSAQDSEGNALSEADLTWTSSDPSVAAIQIDEASGDVVVLAVGEGVATITATIEDRSGTAEITVRALDLATVDPGTFLTCGLTTDGTAFCWGVNGDALLGVGATTDDCPGFADLGGDALCSTTPAAVLGGITFASLSVGNGHTCGLDTGGNAYCWGVNNDGRLGTGDTLTAVTPVAVTGGLTFLSIDAGGAHTCGLSSAGAAFCWGSNENVALGTATVADTCLTLFAPRTSIPCSTTGPRFLVAPPPWQSAEGSRSRRSTSPRPANTPAVLRPRGRHTAGVAVRRANSAVVARRGTLASCPVCRTSCL